MNFFHSFNLIVSYLNNLRLQKKRASSALYHTYKSFLHVLCSAHWVEKLEPSSLPNDVTGAGVEEGTTQDHVPY